MEEPYSFSILIPALKKTPPLDWVPLLLEWDPQVEVLVALQDSSLPLRGTEWGRCRYLSAASQEEALRQAVRHGRHPYLLVLDPRLRLNGEHLRRIRHSLHLYRHRKEVVGVQGGRLRIEGAGFISTYRCLELEYQGEGGEITSPFLTGLWWCLRRDRLESFLKAGWVEPVSLPWRLSLFLLAGGLGLVWDRSLELPFEHRWSLSELVREDRRKIADWVGFPLPEEHRLAFLEKAGWGRVLALLLAGPVLLLLVSTFWWPPFLPPALLWCGLWAGCGLPFARFCGRRRGRLLGVLALLFCLLQSLWLHFFLLETSLLRSWRRWRRTRTLRRLRRLLQWHGYRVSHLSDAELEERLRQGAARLGERNPDLGRAVRRLLHEAARFPPNQRIE